jgi:hypothetical protein
MKSIRRAIFIVGFADYGKTHTLRELFKPRIKFHKKPSKNSIDRIENIDMGFIINNQSNDDVTSTEGYCSRINEFLKHGNPSYDLITTLCPQEKPQNYYVKILTDSVFKGFGSLVFFLLMNKHDKNGNVVYKSDSKVMLDFERFNKGLNNNGLREKSVINIIDIDDDEHYSTTAAEEIKRHLSEIYKF